MTKIKELLGAAEAAHLQTQKVRSFWRTADITLYCDWSYAIEIINFCHLRHEVHRETQDLQRPQRKAELRKRAPCVSGEWQDRL